ncbi:NmrA family NAD(P)-binding protein [Myceligenerans pegani]|uniref:NmrA family NAD(P)-binding protein n=1 Tax=Myceligenerans pegani TaxID=2776917 RepID=A0ABR9N344_9MICO|nr:NmrA family NAD(P)-binding protein [Myceligenerans sp. TRM 65318]MBE1878072.1 NmrA family NAD(P)-binding protein [Myceligenerans sp. TRM 65318]MBE3020343.1 NmrA family NAD(P)-binding protein [Myceligenerans sp. TRM 65318]
METEAQTLTYAVIGATGKSGRRVADLLETEGYDIRRLARGTSPRFDWEEPEGWERALRGVDRLYVTYVPDLAAPGSDAAITRLVEVAREAEVGRVVLLSGRGEQGARRCEEIVLGSGIPATVVSASWFTQNFTEGALSGALQSGFLAIAAGQMREPFVDVDDVAAVVVTVLTRDGHEGHRYELTGPEPLTFGEVAALLTELTGRDIRYVPMDFDEFHAAVLQEAGPETATLLTELCREVFDGRNEKPTDGVREILGRAPRGVRAVLADALTAARRA